MIPAALEVETWLAERAGLIAERELTPSSHEHTAAAVEAMAQLGAALLGWADAYPSPAVARAAEVLRDARTPRQTLDALQALARVRDAMEAM